VCRSMNRVYVCAYARLCVCSLQRVCVHMCVCVLERVYPNVCLCGHVCMCAILTLAAVLCCASHLFLTALCGSDACFMNRLWSTWSGVLLKANGCQGCLRTRTLTLTHRMLVGLSISQSIGMLEQVFGQ
jgi:hypothetical protein